MNLPISKNGLESNCNRQANAHWGERNGENTKIDYRTRLRKRKWGWKEKKKSMVRITNNGVWSRDGITLGKKI